MSALDFEQTKKYINHQLKSAGCGRPLFPDDVISRIQEKAKGMPAYINTRIGSQNTEKVDEDADRT